MSWRTEMNVHHATSLAERAAPAIADLQAMIRHRYPGTTFIVAHGDDPEGIYLKAVVDIEDVDEVLDQQMLDRLFDLQVGEALPLYLIPIQPAYRVLAVLEKPAFTGIRQPPVTASFRKETRVL